MFARGWIIGALVMMAACMPPLRVGAGGGGGAGTVVTQDRDGDQSRDPAARIGQIRGAVTLAALKDNPRRAFDFSVGASADWTRAAKFRKDLHVSLFGEAVWFAMNRRINATQTWRLGPLALAETLSPQGVADNAETGYGFATGFLVEFVDFTSYRGTVAAARGDMGIGISPRVGIRRDHDGTYTYAIISVELRTPGVISVPVPEPRPR